VYFSPTSASDAITSVWGQLWCCNTSHTSARPGNICWLRPVNEDSHLEDFACYATLHLICNNRHSVTRPVLVTCRVSLSHQTRQWLYYTPIRLQSVFNAVARIIYTLWRKDHVSPLLHNMHWLRVPHRSILAYWILSCPSCLPLLVRHSASIICPWSATSHWYWLSSSAAICLILIAARLENKSHHHWWSFNPRRCHQCLIQSATVNQIFSIIARI